MPEDSGDRTEEPTEFRRQEARRKGQVARSMDLTAAGGMVAASFVILLFGLSATQSLAELMSGRLVATTPTLIAGDLPSLFSNLLSSAANIVLPVMAIMVVAGLLLNWGQFGFLLSWEALTPSLARLSPLKGLGRLFSVQSVIRLGSSLGKLVIVIAIAGFFAFRNVPELVHFVELEWETISAFDLEEPFREGKIAPPLMSHVWSSLIWLAFEMAVALFAWGILDYGFQRWKLTRDLRMTKQELKNEMKNMDGDPTTRMRRREVHRKLAEARELGEVPNADVIITNPTHYAIAIRFDPETMSAPKVLAKGQGEIARRIREIAASHRIPIIERKPLARALYYQVKVGQEIPLEMYEVFVEIMSYVYQLSGKMAKLNTK